jgi:putative ABC transport system permease protein
MRWDYVKLGVKNLRQRQLRSWLTMIGIFIGIATVVSLIALGAGLKAAVSAQFNSLGTDRLTIAAKGGGFGPPGQGTAVMITEDDLRVVQRSQYVSVATGRLLRGASVLFNDKRRSVFLASVPAETEERDLILSVQNVRAAEGRIPRPGDGYRVAVGSEYTSDERFGRRINVGDSIVINGKKVEVIGVLTKRGTVTIDSAILMDEDAMRELLDVPTEYSVIVAQVPSADLIDLAQEAIEKDLRSSRNVREGREDFTVETPGSVLSSFNTVIGGVTAVLVGIAAISLLVGGIGIMNTMYTAVLERTREIGIMKAVGARNHDVLAIFMFESGLLGLIGGLIGVALGAGLSQIVVIAGSVALGPGVLASQLSLPLILGALGFSFVIGVLAGLLPAYEAAMLPPVEALRK